ncbi:MAG: HPF/RaiA family ribosome-associated protein [Geminicoccaceae bacterium]|nr:HPF/RaiA family ribosome-associated protein [Geminicoccaceae bacterium]
MKVPLELSFHNVQSSEALERKVRERVDKLHRFFDRITSCHVAIEVPHRSQANALAYHVRIEVRVPRKELVVSRDPGPHGDHFDPYVVVRDAFDAMERQLEEHSRKVRGEVKTLQKDGNLQGRVVRKLENHGFIATTDGREVYFHRNAVVGVDFDRLSDDEAVELVLMDGEGPAGTSATTVKRIGAMQLDPKA